MGYLFILPPSPRSIAALVITSSKLPGTQHHQCAAVNTPDVMPM